MTDYAELRELGDAYLSLSGKRGRDLLRQAAQEIADFQAPLSVEVTEFLLSLRVFVYARPDHVLFQRGKFVITLAKGSSARQAEERLRYLIGEHVRAAGQGE